MHRAPQETRTYFVTAVAYGRRTLFQVEDKARLLLEVIQSYRQQGKFELYAFVVMPDHVHLLLTPAQDVPLEKAVQFIKGGFSFRLKSKLEVWERGYHDCRIADRAGFDSCKHYIEQNPVRKRWVSEAAEYAHSSAAMPDAVDPCPAWFGGGQG